ncbi:longitudinals lacking protein, isoforms J/P/Q/S/Z-like [Teleopsis dalmanni]|uniref:longitudinals lacking protein, isoforms J/P/Q/S/Z-like n=1 Tax=Teleopsis dalmanni TaxID=139649 RepID=UPI0018CE92F4|nr:longitudinals lacking protein, isoforms J/P/Q/S/Z-like [Teleopsis dalmanni]
MGHDASTTSVNQNESRIRVRNWLMMADQSILEKSIQDTVGSDKLTTSNAITNVPTNKTLPVSSSNSINSSTINSTSGLPVIDPNTQTMTRIGSIGRTTIACITPAGVGTQGGAHPLKNGIGVSAAALAAAGVELDPIDESMTEVIVKIENSNCSVNDEEDEEEHTEDENEDNDYTYDLKLSSPMSWAFDTVKVENEEFEDIMLTEQDNNTEDDDDLLTTAAATTKQAAETSMVETRDSRKRCGTNNVLASNRSKKRSLSNHQQNQVVQQQQQQQLLEQQQHLQHLQLQPNPHSLQIKLSTIPATITSITPKPSTSTILTSTTNNAHTSTKMADFQSVVSDDKRYRILIQNQRTRKESLEHSEDMIYNSDIEKPWVCRNCNRNYKWKNSLKCHLKNECGQPPRYFCSKLCGYATNVHSNLKRHLNTKCRDRIDEDQKSTNNNSNNTYTVVMQKNE